MIILVLHPNEPDPHIGRTVLDQTGNRVTIPLPFRGATPLFQGIGEYLYVTRDPDSILDSQTISLDWLGHSFLLDLFPQLRALHHNISLLDQQTANQERLLRLNPSAIFVYATVAGPLRRVGLPALCLAQAWSTGQVFDRARVFAQSLGQNARAEELARDFQAAIANVRHDLGPVPPQEQPAVAELFILPTGVILEIGHGEADQDAFNAAGVVNASLHQHTAKVGIETVLRLDPASILLLPNPSPSPRSFMADARWQALGAVQRRAVYRRPLGANGGFEGIVEYPLFARWLAELNHSERLAPRLRIEVERTIQQQFGYRLSNAQLDTFLNISENSSSADYARFAAHLP